MVRCWLLAATLVVQQAAVAQSRPNLRLLKDVPESELFLVMNVVADGLGVHCDFCHVRREGVWQWASDAKPEKAIGRDMIAMVQSLNRTSFGGRAVVTCYSCHRGSLHVENLAPLPPKTVEERAPQPAAPLPAVEEVLRRYRNAIGANGKRDTPLTITGTVERSEGRTGAFEVALAAHDDFSIRLTTAQSVATQRVTPHGACIQSAAGVQVLAPDDEQRARSNAAIYLHDKVSGLPLRSVRGTEMVRGRRAYAVDATPPEDRRRRTLFFDAASGLLLRELTVTPTAFLDLPEQVDYDDYRDIGGGVKVPFSIITSNAAPYDTATRRISAVRAGAAPAADPCSATPPDR
jgi:hypothetical protein